MRKIIHVDMDCFYAAVECKYQPQYRGLPLAIGGPADSRSVLCTASYEARRYGVKSAMPSSIAKRLCPSLIILPPNFERYRQESERVHKIFERFTHRIEPLSLDEAYLDVTGSEIFNGSATRIAQEIRRLISSELGLTASAGVGPNKFLAKVASDWNKPNGLFVVTPETALEFASHLPVEKIFGVGKVTAQKMKTLGLHTCLDIQKTDLFTLKRYFGSRAYELQQLSYGIDHRDVQTHWEPKSMTVEETFEKDLFSVDEILATLPSIYASWMNRYRSHPEHCGKICGIVVKIKFCDFKQTTHEMSFKGEPSLSDFIKLITKAYQRGQKAVRLVGLGVRLQSQTVECHEQLSWVV